MNEMKEEGRSIRKTQEAWRADYKTTTTIKVMSDSEAKSSVFFFEHKTLSFSSSRQLTQAYSTNRKRKLLIQHVVECSVVVRILTGSELPPSSMLFGNSALLRHFLYILYLSLLGTLGLYSAPKICACGLGLI